MSIVCPNCGKEVPETASFCTGCGTRLEKPATVVATPVAEEPVAVEEVPVAEEVAFVAQETVVAEAPVTKETAFVAQAPVAVMEAPVAVPTPTPVPSTPLRRTPTWWKVIRCIFSIPLTAVLTALLVTVIGLFGLKNITRAETLEGMIKDMDIPGTIAQEMSNGETDSLAEALYDEYYEVAIESNADIVLSQDELEEFFEKSTIEDFIAEKGGSFLSAFLNGENNAKITKDEIIELIEDNEKVIKKITGGETLSENDYAMIEEFIDKENLTEQLDLEKMGLDKELSESMSLMQTLYSDGLWLVVGVALFVLLLIALLNLFGRCLTALYSGIALLLSGGIASLTLVAKNLILSTAHTEAGESEMKILTPVVETVFGSFATAGLIAAGAGLLCIILFTIVRIVGQKKRV